jgi:ADP-L-glycero-D-manno-heptose 6-epimerase
MDIARAIQDIHGNGKIENIPFPKDLIGKYQKFTEASLDNLRQAGYSEDFLSLEEGIKKYFDQLSSSNGLYL